MLSAEEKEKLEKAIRKQKYILASAQAKITRLTAQLETGVMKKTKTRVKADQKQTKTAPKTNESEVSKKEEKGFFDDFSIF